MKYLKRFNESAISDIDPNKIIKSVYDEYVNGGLLEDYIKTKEIISGLDRFTADYMDDYGDIDYESI